MVNTGKPSGACNRCKALRARCDTARPACSRCARRGSRCVYAAGGIFRSMNTWSHETVQARVTKKLAEGQYHEAADVRSGSCSPLLVTVPLDWPNHALGPFFSHFLQNPDNVGSTWGFMPFLPILYASSEPHGHVVQAVNACALSALANRSKMLPLAVQARHLYCAALRRLCDSMGNPRVAAAEGALSTMMLLAMYESISGNKPPEELFHAHVRGQCTMLRQKATGIDWALNAGMVGHTNRRNLWRDLGLRQRPKLGMVKWPMGTYRGWLDEASARFTAEIADICGRVRELQDHPTQGRDEAWRAQLVDVMTEALTVQCSISDMVRDAEPEYQPLWRERSANLEPAFRPDATHEILGNAQCAIPITDQTAHMVSLKYATHPGGNDLCADGPRYSPQTDIYSSRPIAHLWNFLRCPQLHLIRSLIDIRLMLDRDTGGLSDVPFPPAHALRARLSDLVHDIAASVAYILGEVALDGDGKITKTSPEASGVSMGHNINVLYYLHKIVAIPGLDDRIKLWALDMLEKIGTEGCIRVGLSLRKIYL